MVRINRFLYISFDVCIVTVVPDGTAINIQATPISPNTIVYTWDNDLPIVNIPDRIQPELFRDRTT